VKPADDAVSTTDPDVSAWKSHVPRESTTPARQCDITNAMPTRMSHCRVM